MKKGLSSLWFYVFGLLVAFFYAIEMVVHWLGVSDEPDPVFLAITMLSLALGYLTEIRDKIGAK